MVVKLKLLLCCQFMFQRRRTVTPKRYTVVDQGGKSHIYSIMHYLITLGTCTAIKSTLGIGVRLFSKI